MELKWGRAAEPRQIDSINHLVAGDRGRVVVASSHGGLYSAYKALDVGVGSLVLNDAGVGRNQAGVASLAYCEQHGLAAAVVAHSSARIGDVADMICRGRISGANARAHALGVRPGLACRDALELLHAGAAVGEKPKGEVREHRHEVALADSQLSILCIDSASLIRPEDEGRIVVTGSHGGLIGGDPAKAINTACAFAAFNDAGLGADDAGASRLPALDRRGIPAVTVGHMSAEIGNGRSTLDDGVISRANEAARALGAESGMSLKDMLRLLPAGYGTSARATAIRS